MAHSTLSRRDLTAKTSAAAKVISDLQSHGYPAYFYIGTPEGVIHYGSKVIEELVTNNLDDIMNHPQYMHTPSDVNADDSVRASENIAILRSNLTKTESAMKMMDLRLYLTSLIPKVVPHGNRQTLYKANNRPIWFPGHLIWQPMNKFSGDELRVILTACYNHFGLDIPVRPDPPQPMSPGRRRRIMSNYRQMKQCFTQGTQTTPSTSPIAGHTTPSLMSVGVVTSNISPLSVSTAPSTAEVHLLPSTPEDTSEQTSPIMTRLQPMVVTAEVHPLPPNSRVQQTHPILTTLQHMEVPTTSANTTTSLTHRMPLPAVENTQCSALTELRRTQRLRNQKRTYPFM